MSGTKVIRFTAKDKGTPCSLLIPWSAYERMHRRRKVLKQGNREYVSYLAHAALKGKLAMKPARYLKKQYQENGVPRKKWSVRADDRTWHLLKCIAGYYGISICQLYVILLMEDLAHGGKQQPMASGGFVIKRSERFNASTYRVRRVIVRGSSARNWPPGRRR